MNYHPALSRCAILLVAFLSTGAFCRADHGKTCDSLLDAYHKINQFNGAALVAENGKIILAKGYGQANLEWDIPCDADTKFRLGSVTKQFTAVLILQLAAEGRLDLQGKLSDYLPEYRKDTGGRITIHHLLCHASGIPSYTDRPDMRTFNLQPWPVDSFVRLYCSRDLQFEPGERFQYSNSGYFLLGAVIEKLTGKTYEQNLRERILKPAGMTSTGYDHAQTIQPKRASGYQRIQSELVNCPYLDMSVPYAAGAMYSTVNDLFLWDQSLQGDKLLPEKQRDLMFSPRQKIGNGAYGYGWFIVPFKTDAGEKTVIQHAGGINGFTSMIWRIPQDRHLVVLLDNWGSAGLQEISRSLSCVLYDQKFPRPRRSFADTILTAVRKDGIKKALALYSTLNKKHPDEYNFNENELNQIGYILLGQQRVKEAIEIFKLNAKLYPKSGNVYDSLGEAYLAAGNKELGIKNYRMSLQMDKTNQNAIEVLKRLGASN